MPRLAPVTRTVLSAIVMCGAPGSGQSHLFIYRTTSKSWHGHAVQVKVNLIERQTSTETHPNGHSRQAAHIRPGHRPAPGAGPVLGTGLRGHLAQRPGPGHG